MMFKINVIEKLYLIFYAASNNRSNSINPVFTTMLFFSNIIFGGHLLISGLSNLKFPFISCFLSYLFFTSLCWIILYKYLSKSKREELVNYYYNFTENVRLRKKRVGISLLILSAIFMASAVVIGSIISKYFSME